jgi:hypothetical protein
VVWVPFAWSIQLGFWQGLLLTAICAGQLSKQIMMRWPDLLATTL